MLIILMIEFCHAAAAGAQGRRRPPPLAVADDARVPMAYVEPNIGTPTAPDSRIKGSKEKRTPDQNRHWRRAMGPLAPTELSFGSTPDKILTKYFKENGATVVDGLRILTAPGANHGMSGIMTIETDDMFRHPFFVIERTGEDQREQLIYGKDNPFDAGQKLETLIDRLHAAYVKLDQGIVALVDRIRITSDDDEPKYLELYLAVEGYNCYQLLKAVIGKPECTVDMINVCEAIGRKVKEMEDEGSPHEDCHLGNFLSPGEGGPVFAIDFRRIAEAQLDPFSNFSEKLLRLFTSKLKVPTDISLIEIYAEQYFACMKAFLDQATTDSDVVSRVLTDLKMTCANRCESKELASFYCSLLDRLKIIDGE